MTTDRKRIIGEQVLGGVLKSWLPIGLAVLAGGVKLGSMETKLEQEHTSVVTHIEDKDEHVTSQAQVDAAIIKQKTDKLTHQVDKMDTRQREILNVVTKLESRMP